MADPKLFAGPRLRRIRLRLQLNQTTMASSLGISPSYLNLLERNQRPVTAQLLIKLAETHDIDPREVKGEADGLSIAELRDVFTDPLLADEMPSDEELVELSEATPNVAAGILRLYAAWRDTQNQVSKLSDYLAADDRGEAPSARMLPKDAVHHYFTSRGWYFADLETLADTLRSDLGAERGQGYRLAALVEDRLKQEFDLRVQMLPPDAMVGQRRRLDRHSNRIFINSALPIEAQHIEIIAGWLSLSQIARLREAVSETGLEGEEATRLASMELQFYLAQALVVPMAIVSDARARGAPDLFDLATRQGVAPMTAALRLIAHEAGQAQGTGAGAGARSFTLAVTESGQFVMRRAAGSFPVAELNRDSVMREAIGLFGRGRQEIVDAKLVELQRRSDMEVRHEVTGFVQETLRSAGMTHGERLACFYARAIEAND